MSLIQTLPNVINHTMKSSSTSINNEYTKLIQNTANYRQILC